MSKKPTPPPKAPNTGADNTPANKTRPVEINGPKGLEPTRYGDWEKKGIASDF